MNINSYQAGWYLLALVSIDRVNQAIPACVTRTTAVVCWMSSRYGHKAIVVGIDMIRTYCWYKMWMISQLQTANFNLQQGVWFGGPEQRVREKTKKVVVSEYQSAMRTFNAARGQRESYPTSTPQSERRALLDATGFSSRGTLSCRLMSRVPALATNPTATGYCISI